MGIFKNFGDEASILTDDVDSSLWQDPKMAAITHNPSDSWPSWEGTNTKEADEINDGDIIRSLQNLRSLNENASVFENMAQSSAQRSRSSTRVGEFQCCRTDTCPCNLNTNLKVSLPDGYNETICAAYLMFQCEDCSEDCLSDVSASTSTVPDLNIKLTNKKRKSTKRAEAAKNENDSSNGLNQYIVSHTGRKKLKCAHPGCTKSYTSHTALRYHLSTHSGIKPVKCEFPGCNKTFALEYVMKQHLPSHKGVDKPFKCDYKGCNKAYVASSALIQHKRKHTGEKPFKCPAPGCDKAYVSRSGLIPHLKKHMAERKKLQ